MKGPARMPVKQSPRSSVMIPTPTGSPLEVLRVFLKLGLASFGGPIAHLGYFREEFVVHAPAREGRARADTMSELGQQTDPLEPRGGCWPTSPILFREFGATDRS